MSEKNKNWEKAWTRMVLSTSIPADTLAEYQRYEFSRGVLAYDLSSVK
jgi:hypothetical protein